MKTCKRVMLVLGIGIIVAFVLMVILMNRTAKSDFSFEPLDSQFSLLERVYPEWFGDPVDVMKDPAGVRVVCDYLELKSLMSSESEGWEESRDKFLADEMDYVVSTSIQVDYWASLAAFDYLEAAYHGETAKVDEIAKICTEVAPDLREHLNVEVQSFKTLASNEGFLDEQMNIRPDKRNIIKLLHRYQWAKIASYQLPNARIQPPEERMAVFRWQIEQSKMPFEKKLARIEAFRSQNPSSYDYDYAKAIIFAENGDSRESCLILKEKLADIPQNDKYRKSKYEQAIKLLSGKSDACK